MIRRALFIACLAAGSLWADGPRYGGYDKNTALEFDNVYLDIRNPQITFGQASSFTVTALSVSTITAVSSATITNLSVTTLSGVTLGKLKQVVQCTSTTPFSTTSNTFQTTNLSCAITPTASTSKVFVLATSVWFGASGVSRYASIFRGATNLGDTSDGLLRDTSGLILGCAMSYLDSPSTTSATTYAVKLRNSDGATSTTYGRDTIPQVITLWEIGS